MPPAEVRSARRELFGRGSIYTFGSALQAGSALLVLPLVTRLLPAEAFGVVATATVLLQLLGLVAALGLPSVVMLEHLSGDLDGPHRARRLVGVTIVAAVAVALIADLTSGSWSRLFGAIDDGPALRLAVWGAVPLAVLAAAQAVLRSSRQAGRFVLATAMVTLGGPLTGLAAITLHDATAEAYLTGFVVGAGLGASVAALLARTARPRRTDGPLVRRTLTTALPLVPHSVALFALLAIDRLIIERSLGLEAAARYQVAYLLGAAGLSLLAAVNNAWSPMVLGAPDADRWRLLASTSADLERGVVVVVTVTALAAPLLLRLAAPATYDLVGLTLVTAVVAASSLPFLWYLGAGHVLLAHRRTVVLAKMTPLVALATVAVGLLVIPHGGLGAAAMITVGSYLVLAVWVRHEASRLAAVPWNRTASIQAAVAVGVAVLVGVTLPTRGTLVAVRMILLGAVALWAARGLRRSRSGALAVVP